MQQALQCIQDEKTASSLPSELQMTTQTLLSSLPSSAHFSLLPRTIRSYKPYIGAASSSPSVAASLLQQKLGEWFTRSLDTVRAAGTQWLASLESVKEVWDIRTSSFTIVAKLRGLDAHEQARIRAMVDSLCQRQTVSVWHAALSNAEMSFHERLTSALQSLKSTSDESISGKRYTSDDCCMLRHMPRRTTSGLSLPSSSAALDFPGCRQPFSGRRTLQAVQGGLVPTASRPDAIIGRRLECIGRLI